MGKDFLRNYEIIENTTKRGYGYLLIGKRGAKYYLIPNINNKHLYFVYNPNAKSLDTHKIKGRVCFTDKNGYLEPANIK